MTPEVKTKKEPLPYHAQQRAQAVLSIWTERRRPREVCQELAIRPAVLSHWEKQALTETVRREFTLQRQAELRRITWHVPGLVWSLDDAQLIRLASHQLHLHQVQDLASRYKFTPWVGDRVLGESVAAR
jgi:hypothetical protein